MNFDQFEKVVATKPRKVANSAIPEQNFTDMKFRVAVKVTKKEGELDKTELDPKFFMATEKFAELNLNHPDLGLAQFTAPDGNTIVAIVARADADYYKASKKSKDGKKAKSFKSPKLQAALEKLGILAPAEPKVSQFINMTLVAENVAIKGVSCSKVFTLSKGAAKIVAPVAEKTVATPVAETAKAAPVAEAATAAAPAKGEWD